MKDIVKRLIDAENLTSTKVNQIISELESSGCTWRDLGDIELNHARVNIVANPESTIIERITNAMDAVLEKNALTNAEIKDAASPREAVAKLMGVKDGYLCNITDNKTQAEVTKKSGVEVFVKVGDEVNLFFRDNGIGLTAEEMPTTILGLNESNKFRKPYVIGQYGQGGSTTCAFSRYTVIVTRKAVSDTDNIAFTIIRFNELNDDPLAKDGKFEYIVQNRIPPVVSAEGIDFQKGTLVAHLDYATEINKGFINYFQVLDNYLFDPPLPYGLYYDEWHQGGVRNLMGARRRIEMSDLKQYGQEYTYKVAESPQFGQVKIRYWLLKKNEEKKKNGKVTLETVQANRFLYDDKNSILITYNGQVQGVLSRTILKDDCKFGYIHKSLIIQVECEGLTATGKKFFFTSGRDRLKFPAQKEVTNAVITILSKDEYLKKENEQREQESLTEQIGKDTTEIRKKLAEMLNKLNPGKFKIIMGAAKKSEEGTGAQASEGGSHKEPLAPLPTQTEPSFIRIANKKDPIPIQKGRTCKLLIESDAPDGLLSDANWQFILTDKTDYELQLHSRSDFKGGRLYVFIKCDETVRIGKKLAIQLALKKADKVITSEQRAVAVIAPLPSDRSAELEINAPEIVELTEKHPLFAQFGWDGKTVAEVREGQQTTIFVNMSNLYLINMLQGKGYTEQRANRIKGEYLLHIAFHSFIQHLDFKDNDLKLEEDKEDKIRKDELDRAARTVCTTIMAITAEKN